MIATLDARVDLLDQRDRRQLTRGERGAQRFEV
jgi:hypothetical protein